MQELKESRTSGNMHNCKMLLVTVSLLTSQLCCSKSTPSRYLFSRYYLWCEVPGVNQTMEGCPEENNLVYLIMAALLVPIIFVAYMVVRRTFRKLHHEKAAISRRESMKSMAFAQLQVELFGEKALKKLQHLGSEADLQKLASSFDMGSSAGDGTVHSFHDDDDEESV